MSAGQSSGTDTIAELEDEKVRKGDILSNFVYQQNLKHLHKTLVLATDEPQRSQLLTLIAEEEHKGPPQTDPMRPRYV